ncbi:MAG: hypothetical protein J6A11_11375 [Lachnospiraceae bacterium]|nr:hypothetical protein [Lachnospiraceae bacterium]
MLAQKDSMIKEASDTILQLSQDEQIRLRCEARADYLYWQKIEEEYKKELEENYQKVLREKQQLVNDNQKLVGDNQKLADDIQKLENDNREKNLLIAQLQAQLDQKKKWKS